MLKTTIVLVDDDANHLRIVKTALENVGWAIEAFPGVEEAFQFLNAQTPDLIISDVMMPQVDGIQFFKKLRAIPRLADVPFLFLTANKDMKLADEVLNLGAIDFLIKPYNVNSLRAKVQSLLTLKAKSEQSGLIDRGDLEKTPLLNILQSCEQNTFSGKLRVQSGELEGVFTFERGVIVNASLGDFSQDESLDEMLNWQEGCYILEQKKFKVAEGAAEEDEAAFENEDTQPAEAPQTAVEDFYGLLENGRKAFRDKDYDSARTYWEKALALRPDDKKIRHNLNILKKKRGEE